MLSDCSFIYPRSSETTHLIIWERALLMLLFAFTILSLASHALAQDVADDRGYAISYNGSLHGSYVSGKAEMRKSCGTGGAYYFSGLNDTIMKVGPPAAGDKNPFFFRLNHAGGATQDKVTSDALFNLQVISAWADFIYYESYEASHPVDFINMNESTLSVVDTGPGLGHDNELPYYSLTGGISSLGTSDDNWNGFNFQIPLNYSDTELEEGSLCQNLSETTIDW